MKKTSFQLPSLIIIPLIVALFCFNSCDQKGTPATQTTLHKDSSKNEIQPITMAYVNLDTLEEKYDFYKDAKKNFDQRQINIEAELRRQAQQLQNEYIALQKKAQSGTFTESEGKAAEKRLASMQENLENKRNNLTSQLLKDQDAFTQNLQSQLDSFLVEYNKDKNYDFIISYVKGGSLLLVNPTYDITDDVVKGMNKKHSKKKDKKEKPQAADSTKA